MNDTIAAVATASGVGSVAIVRVSGPLAKPIAEKICRFHNFKPRYAHLKELYNTEGELIDQAIVIWFQAPRSFTTEEVVEFQCHGGTIVAERILQAVLAYGARLAEPGEFTRRAFLGGRMDLSEAEAVAKLIEASSEDAAKILARQMRGELRRFVEETRDALLRAVAHAEVSIDYAEEDLPDTLVESLKEQLKSLAVKLHTLAAASQRRRGLVEGFRVAIVGRPNVGKSSLLNALLHDERAIVSEIEGTTRDTIEERLRVGTHLVRIVDTAGIRESEDRIEKIGIARSLRAVEQSDVVIALFDGSRPWSEEDARILKMLADYREQKEIIVAVTKTDLPSRLDFAKLQGWEPLCLRPGERGEQIVSVLQKRLDRMGGSDELMLISSRQIDAVRRAAVAVDAAMEPLGLGELELFSFHLNEAVEAVASISRPVDFNEIMDKMFGEFCLGK